MSTFYLDKPDKTIKTIAAACFPGYTGKKYRISTDIPTDLSSYWSGGSRTSYAFYSLDRGDVAHVESNHPFFEAGKPSHLESLPKGFLLVAYSIFAGIETGITIYVNESDLAPMLPEPVDLTDDEKIVLTFTKSYKSSYAGIPNYRLHEAKRVHGITLARWNAAKDTLIGKKLLNKAGAITADGRNAISGNEVRKY